LARQTYTFDFEPIVIAQWLKKWLKEDFNKDAYYVPNGLDTSLFYQDEPLVPKNERLRVLLEGPIDVPFKGMKEAFEVVDGMDCEVWCVSSAGKPKSNWHCDKFFEKVPLKDMRQIYCSCDVLIKMTKIEGFFMPPLEMMACGGTVITNKVTGYDEYIKDGYNGLVVEQGDVSAARKKLNMLIRDRKLLDTLKQGGKETAKNWTWEESNRLFEEILEKNISLCESK
jgi:glycosyltransferase involved in cell wall biosynthesis